MLPTQESCSDLLFSPNFGTLTNKGHLGPHRLYSEIPFPGGLIYFHHFSFQAQPAKAVIET